MEKYDVELLPAAYADLDEIFDYIMADNPQAAAGMLVLDSIVQSLRRLENFPYSGAPLLERSLKKFDFRMVIAEPYIAFYRFIDNKVLIYRILHGARNYPHLLTRADARKIPITLYLSRFRAENSAKNFISTTSQSLGIAMFQKACVSSGKPPTSLTNCSENNKLVMASGNHLTNCPQKREPEQTTFHTGQGPEGCPSGLRRRS